MVQDSYKYSNWRVPFSLRRRVRDEVKSGSCFSIYGIITLLIFILSANFTSAQTRPTDSLFVWVSFSEDKILIDIPESYMNYRTVLPAIPKHVRIRELNIFVPKLPAKETLLSNLKKELLITGNPKTKDDQLKYLGKVVLLLFYSNNDLTSIPDESLKALKALSQESQVKKEAVLVKKWIDMI